MTNLIKWTTLCLLTTSLFACSTIEPQVVVKTDYVEKEIPLQPHPKGLTMNPVYFYAVTPENLDEFLERSGAEPVASKSLSAPVGQASQEVAAAKDVQNNVAITPVSTVNNNSSVNNNYNSTTVQPPPPSRTSDPTFQRMQNANFGGI